MADTGVSKPQGDSTWYEPDSQSANSVYPHNQGFYSKSGHFVEMDDTPDYERIRIQHRIGNYTEIQSDGTEVHKITGDNYEIVVKNNHVLIKGYCSVTIQGDSKLNVEGDVYQNIQGNVYQNIEGEMDAVIAGEVNLTSESDINITAGGLSGQVNINAPFGVHIDSDVTVSGSISSTGYIASSENIVASKKVLGALGLVTPTGVLVGPIPDSGVVAPGIYSIGPITSVTSVEAPIISDLAGPLAIFRATYTAHTHPAINATIFPPYVGAL
jgi:hypothetical protein